MAEEQQSNIRQESNFARTGINMDQTPNQIPKGALTYALNASLENYDNNSVNYQNEPCNEFCLNFPTGYQVIGQHFINEKAKHIFFLANPTTEDSEIGYMDNNDCIYRTFINGKCLNFNVKYPIHKSVHKITNCSTEVYWTDGLNPRRFIDLDKKPLKTEIGDTICDVDTFPEIDCNKIKVQPNFRIPQLKIKEVTNVGNLIAGTYQFAIQYCNVTGDAYTSYYSVTNPTPIGNPLIITPDFNYPVGKAIVLEITDIDATGYFEYFNLAVIKTINATTSVELVGTYFIDELTKEVTYTGQNVEQIRLTIADIFEKHPYYEIAQDVTAVQDVLVWDNLSSIDRINYQQIANQIPLQWQTYKMPATENYANELNATNLRGYLRDEVYAFEIVFLLDNGKQTDGFHIPGRVRNYSEIGVPDVPDTNPDFVGAPDYVDPITGVGYSPYWKIYNTGSVIGPASGPKINNATPYEFGEFAYWESTETYPCNEDQWGDLAGTPIRHHKFPDVLVSPIFESDTPEIILPSGKYNAATLKMDERSVFPIGVKFDPQQIYALIRGSNLTQEQKDSIVGFKIVRGDRSTNQSIVAKGILRNVGRYTRENNNYYFPNYPYNDLREDPFLLEANGAYSAQCLNFKYYPTSNGSLRYTDCITGQEIVKTFTSGQSFTLCSLRSPTIISGTIKIGGMFKVVSTTLPYSICNYVDENNVFRSIPITNIPRYIFSYITPYITSGAGVVEALTTYYQYTLSSASSTRFSYVDVKTFNATSITVTVGNPVTIYSYIEPYRVSGDTNFTINKYASIANPICYPDPLNPIDYTNPTLRQVFNSPETSFGQPFLGNIVKLENVIYGKGRAHFVEVKKHARYKFITYEAQRDALDSSFRIASITPTPNISAAFAAFQSYLTIYINGITRRNYTYSYNSIAKYCYSAPIANNLGIKQRPLDISIYLTPGVQNVGDDFNINNFQRESSVFLKTIATRTGLPFPSNTNSLQTPTGPAIEDRSRYVASQVDNCSDPSREFDISTVCYYASLKNNFVNQWGQMYSYQTIDTGYQLMLKNLTSQGIAFGGDTFISKFSFKTKLPFFIDNRVNSPDDSDIFYDEIGNVGYPKYFFSARSILSNYYYVDPPNNTPLYNIISIKAHAFDCPNDQSPAPPAINPGRTYYDGKMYLFAYGIPTFYCETSINLDLRQAYNAREGDFFPRVSSGIPDEWLQETVVPIAFDNTYYYNATYSKQNKENFFSHLPIDWKDQLCYTNFPFRAIYSERQQSFTDNRINSWLIYRPISFFDFPQNYGKLTSLDGIQNRAVLARFENKSLMYNTLLTVQTSNPQAAYLGNDTLFRSAPPIDFAETDLGYVGSQHKFLMKIPQGQVTIDAKRGQVFLIGGTSITELSTFGKGLNRFFTDHLAFEILRYFPEVNVDNHFNGIGLHGVFDTKYERIIITKLDYVPVDENVKFDVTTQEFYIEKTYDQNQGEPLVVRETVDVTDSVYFCNKSWTLSYSLITNSWISFHSYIPNFYVAENNFFYSGLNGGCDLEAIAIEEIPPSCELDGEVKVLYCDLDGTVKILYCDLDGTATILEPTTTTTSTTSTSSTTTSTTTTICLCVETVVIEVFVAGDVTYLDCFGNLITQGVGMGPEVLYNPIDCISLNTLGGTAVYTIDSYGPCCTPTTTTTTTTITPCFTYTITNNSLYTQNAEYYDCCSSEPVNVVLDPLESVIVCALYVSAPGCDVVQGTNCSC